MSPADPWGERAPATTGAGRSELEWMERHVAALFRCDARGRLLSTDEPDPLPAPLFYLGRTSAGSLWRFHAELPGAVVREIARLAGREPPLGPGEPPPRPERWSSFCRALGEAGLPARAGHCGPAFRFPEPAAAAAGEAPEPIRVAAEDASILGEELAWLRGQLEARAPVIAVAAEGRAVAAAWTARGSARTSAEAGVETRPGHRGRGLGARVVAAWAAAVRAGGGTPLYSCAWENRSSRALARRLGLVAYGEDLHLGQ